MDVYKIFVSTKYCLFRILFEQCVRILKTTKLPHHLALITDGNRTFAKKRGISRKAAYVDGMHLILRQIEICKCLEIPCVTFFVFSSHNWNRCQSDQKNVLAVIVLFLEKLVQNRGSHRYRIIGDVAALPARIRLLCTKLTDQTMYNDGILIILAINYSARMEITDVATRIIDQKNSANVTEQILSTLMYTSEVVEPDLVIRSSGQKRLSDFLLWQTVSSKLCFTNRNWPECTEWWLLSTLLKHQLK